MTDYVRHHIPSPLKKILKRKGKEGEKNSIIFDLHQGCFSNLTKPDKSGISLKTPLSFSIEMGAQKPVSMVALVEFLKGSL